jgi:hypothetical protein
MSVFIAIIYACLGTTCQFYHSLTFYNTEGECFLDMNRELTAMAKAYPQAQLASACIGIPIKSA